MDTKPVYQHSILAHETYSTRRAYAVEVSLTNLDFTAGTGTITVVPLNNESTSMASWGTDGMANASLIPCAQSHETELAGRGGFVLVLVLRSRGMKPRP